MVEVLLHFDGKDCGKTLCVDQKGRGSHTGENDRAPAAAHAAHAAHTAHTAPAGTTPLIGYLEHLTFFLAYAVPDAMRACFPSPCTDNPLENAKQYPHPIPHHAHGHVSAHTLKSPSTAVTVTVTGTGTNIGTNTGTGTGTAAVTLIGGVTPTDNARETACCASSTSSCGLQWSWCSRGPCPDPCCACRLQ